MNLLTIDSLPESLRGAIAFTNLSPGETLFTQGDDATAVFAVETGRVKLVRYTSEGRMVTFEVVRQGEILAESALFLETYPCTAIAEEASRVVIYPQEAIGSALQNYPELAQELTMILINKIQTLKVRLEWFNSRSAHERLLQYLRFLSGNQTVVNLDRPLKEIAGELGFTPETLSRALARLEQQGAIARNGRLITLHLAA